MFWKTVNLFSDKVTSCEKITLIDEDEITRNGSDTAHILHTFFSNIVTNLKISDYTKCYLLSEFISKPVLEPIVNYRKHPKILKIGKVCHSSNATNFSFSVQRKQVLKEITQ